MEFFVWVELWLRSLAGTVSVAWFVIIGSAVEEIVAPIPSSLVMALAGSIARAQEYGYWDLVFISILAGITKTGASWLIYWLSSKFGSHLINKFGGYFGVNGKKIKNIGNFFTGGLRDTGVVFLARAIPIMPMAPVSVASGILGVPMKAYVAGTFFGTIIRSLIYLMLGYAGLASIEVLLPGLITTEYIVRWIILVAAILLVAYWCWRACGFEHKK